MDKSCRRILFCNFCQNNKGNLSTSVLAYAGGLVSVLFTTPIDQSYKPTPGSAPHAAIIQPQLQFLSPPTVLVKILVPVLLFVFFLAGIYFSHHLPSETKHLINQNQTLTSTVSKGFLATSWYSGDLTSQMFAAIQESKALAAKLLTDHDLKVAVPESKKFRQIPKSYFVPSLRENSASISLRTDPVNRLLFYQTGMDFFEIFLMYEELNG